MCTVFEETRREGIAEGEAKGIIETGYEFGISEEEILARLQKKLNISLAEAQEYVKKLLEIIYVFLTIFLYLLKCPQSFILSALRAFCFCGKPHISRSIFLYFLYQTWLKSW